MIVAVTAFTYCSTFNYRVSEELGGATPRITNCPDKSKYEQKGKKG